MRVRRLLGATLCAFAIACSPPPTPPAEQASEDEAGAIDPLSACLLGSHSPPEGQATGYACDWAAIAAAKQAESLTGRYSIARQGVSGGMEILDPPTGAARLAIGTVTGETAHSCTVSLDAQRTATGLVATSSEAPACTIRVTRGTASTLSVGAEGDCSYFCGARGAFDGEYTAE